MNIVNNVGVGIVSATKQTNTKEIFVYLPGNHPTAEGGVSLDVTRVQKSAVDAKGNAVNTDVLKSNKMVPAYWRPIGEPNRVTPPDVREGSQVSLYQVQGSNTYYWTSWGFSGESMRLESIIYGWNADPNLDKNSDFDISKYYTMTIDTRGGSISLRNSNANGEKSIIDITANYKEGRVSIAGAQKSQLIFDDVEHSLSYVNMEGSLVTVNKKNIMLLAKQDLIVQVGNDLTVDVTNNILIGCENLAVNVGGETHITSPKTTHLGDLDVDGGITSTKNMTAQGTVQGIAGVKTNSIDTDQHVHGNGNDGNDTRGPHMP